LFVSLKLRPLASPEVNHVTEKQEASASKWIG
jgi:hypothetical protein